MGITVNEGGVLYELEKITDNENGVVYDFDNIHSNENGVLYEIFSGRKIPTSLTWYYTNSTSESPTTSNNGFTVRNGKSENKYNNIKSNVFEIIGECTISVHMYSDSSEGSYGMGLDTSDGTEVEYGHLADFSVTVGSGEYYFRGGGGYGNQNGSWAISYTFEITFE